MVIGGVTKSHYKDLYNIYDINLTLSSIILTKESTFIISLDNTKC